MSHEVRAPRRKKRTFENQQDVTSVLTAPSRLRRASLVPLDSGGLTQLRAEGGTHVAATREKQHGGFSDFVHAFLSKCGSRQVLSTILHPDHGHCCAVHGPLPVDQLLEKELRATPCPQPQLTPYAIGGNDGGKSDHLG